MAVAEETENPFVPVHLRGVIDAMRRMGSEISLSHANFRSIIEVIGAASAIITPGGMFLSVNQNAANLMGHSIESLTGASLLELASEDDRAILRDALQAGGSGEFRTVHLTVLGRSGRRSQLTLHQQPISDVRGTFSSFLVIFEVHSGRSPLASDELIRSEAELQSLSNRLTMAHEEERKRVSSELHDGLGQVLTMIKFMVEDSLIGLRKGEADRAVDVLDTTVLRIREAIGEVRRICSELRPRLLDDLGLIPALQWFCRRFQESLRHLHVELECPLSESDVPEPLKADLFRIVQESMNNAAKHANGSSILVRLWKEPDGIHLAIRDDGSGFDASEAANPNLQSSGLGLMGMRDRVESAGGRFWVISAPGAGTEVNAFWQAPQPS